MILDKFIDNISYISFFHEIKGLEGIGRVSFHKEILVFDH
jgi:hypothetical protein